MSNLGKKGEMKVTGLISGMGQCDDRIDLTRHTRTNTPDNGCDIVLHHTVTHFNEMMKISTGELSDFSNPQEDKSKKIQTRIDVKNENNKITKPLAEKFIGDIKKHPDCIGQLLIGNNGLTKGAKEVLDEAQRNYPNKKIGYISNDGVNKLCEVTQRQLKTQNNSRQGYFGIEMDEE
ncbi:hypothetical protein [Neisseria montereyensis]|uniref:Uncharacterized protein n=1 Tax=Neisseria montereyensis TaxID=2973938 RepID=A0ABT2FCY8_9NEIS|nr:hypothetical protein [Neisseria montereyensis]MCS4534032.1 hypothetical protein [Neisseria montereyensis]